MLSWLSAIVGIPAPAPIDSQTTDFILFSLLGVGGMRTAEKIKGVATSKVKGKGK